MGNGMDKIKISIPTLAILITLLFYGWLFNAWATMPVYEWCEWVEGDNGTLTIYHCSSPSNWDKLTDSEEWQGWEDR